MHRVWLDELLGSGGVLRSGWVERFWALHGQGDGSVWNFSPSNSLVYPSHRQISKHSYPFFSQQQSDHIGSSSGSVSWPSGCPEKYSWVVGRRSPDPTNDITLRDLDDSFLDEPPLCPYVERMQGIARRQRDRIRAVEAELDRQAHNARNVEEANEGLYERASSLASYNCIVVNDLEAARASALKYKAGFCIVTCILIICVVYMIFHPTN